MPERATAAAGLLLGSWWTLAAPVLVFGLIPLPELAFDQRVATDEDPASARRGVLRHFEDAPQLPGDDPAVAGAAAVLRGGGPSAGPLAGRAGDLSLRPTPRRARIGAMIRAPLALLALLLLFGCPSNDDDSAALDDDDVEDDDDSVQPDDDDSVQPGDDDDSSLPADDDDSALDCGEPPSVVADVAFTDALGNPSTVLTPLGLTVTVSIQNQGGGTESQTYSSSCIFGWQLDDGAGDTVGGGPDCDGVMTQVDYVCGAEPTVQTESIGSINILTGSPLDPGTYQLSVDTFFYGVTSIQVTVP